MATKYINTDLNVKGNLYLDGEAFTVNTTTVEVEDNILELNRTQGSPDAATATTSGIRIYRGDGVTPADFIFDDADDTWDLTNNLNVAGTMTASGATITGSLTIDTGGSNNALVLRGTNPTINLLDDDTNADDFYIHVNSNKFYVLANRTDSDPESVGTGWEGPHPLELQTDTSIGYLFGDRIFDDGYHPNADKWTTARTITLGGDLTGNVSIDGSANVTLTAAVVDDSHTHDGRYYTESEADAKFTKYVDLTSQVQLSNYSKSVIALCSVDNTNTNLNSYSIGTLTFHRTNGIHAPIKLDIAIEKRYNVEGTNVVAVAIGGDGMADNVQFVTFEYNNVVYGGIEFYFNAAQHHEVTFYGRSNFDIFGLDYYDDNASTQILNQEVYNSISTTNVVLKTDFFFNNQAVLHDGNYSTFLDTRYYTETELDAGQLDNRYYTETEADTRFLLNTTDTLTGDLTVTGDTMTGTLTIGRPTGLASIKAGTTSGGNLVLDSSGGMVYLNNYVSDDVVLATGGGNVGIGTTSPSEKLQVSGNVLASSFIKSGGTSSQFLKADGSVDSSSYLTTTGKAADSNLLDGIDSSEFARVKKGTVTLTKDSYVRVARVEGDSLASAIRMTVNGTTGSVVMNGTFDINVNHSSDIMVKSQCGHYTTIYLQIISTANEDFDIYLKYTSGSGTTCTTYIEIFPLNSETITISPTATAYTTATFEHVATAGEIKYGKWNAGVTNPIMRLGTGEVVTTTNYGGALDSYYLRSDESDTMDGNLTVTGTATVGSSSDAASYLYVLSSTTGESEVRLGDTDTDAGSIAYNNGSDLMKFRAGAADRMYLSATGLGVGDVANSVNKLQVTGQARVSGSLMVGDSSLANAADANIHIKNSGTAVLRLEDSDDANIYYDLISNFGGGFYINEGSSTRFMIEDGTGNVGIGTTLPSDILDVQKNQNATTNFYFRNTDTTNASSRAYLNLISGDTTLTLAAINGLDTYIAGTFGRKMYFQQNIGGTVNMLIDSSGNVGIGTTSPAYPLDVNGFISTNSSSNTSGLLIRKSSSTIGYVGQSGGWEGNTSTNLGISAETGNGIRFYVNGSASAVGAFDTAGKFGIGTTSPSEKLSIASGNISMSDSYAIKWGNNYLTGLDSVDALRLFTAGAERIRIDSLGNVGIGTTSPQGKFTTVGTYATVTHSYASNDAISITSTGVNGGGYNAFTIGQANSTNNVGVMRFKYVGSGSTSNYLGLGFYANDDIIKIKPDTNVEFKGDVKAYVSSDRFLKDNIKPIKKAIDKVKKIGGYEFDWNDNQTSYKGHDIGVIAQEIEAVMPEIVTTRDNGYKAVKYDRIVPLLIEAIKEQQEQIDELKRRLDGSTK